MALLDFHCFQFFKATYLIKQYAYCTMYSIVCENMYVLIAENQYKLNVSLSNIIACFKILISVELVIIKFPKYG